MEKKRGKKWFKNSIYSSVFPPPFYNQRTRKTIIWTKIVVCALASVAQFVESPRAWRCCWFDSLSGDMPSFRLNAGGRAGGNQSVFHSHIDVSLSLPLLSFLSKNLYKSIGGKKFQFASHLWWLETGARVQHHHSLSGHSTSPSPRAFL